MWSLAGPQWPTVAFGSKSQTSLRLPTRSGPSYKCN